MTSTTETTLSSTPDETEARLTALIDHLDLSDKVYLLTGRDFWTTRPMPKIGLRALVFSDGPSGVRGELWDERDPSLNLPSITALAASWDRALSQRYGASLAVEARRKGVDVVLGPTVNLHRSPLGGRNFEAFSEDPLLTTELAKSYVAGMQLNGVGATPKHYVANDYETERYTASTEVSERALRELYLFAFEKTVTDARAWLVMTAYNAINGVTATENDLLETPLNTEWEFDGVVVSDWAAVRSVESAKHGQDLVMPGPDGPWDEALIEAVRSGQITEQEIDRKVLRLLRLAARVGALDGFTPVAPQLAQVEDGTAFAREAASAGMVLAQNTVVGQAPALPIDPTSVASIAVIGHNAGVPRTQGGGSATVLPEEVVTPLDGIRAAFPDARVTYTLGAVVQEGICDLPLAQMTNPVTGEPGLRVSSLLNGEEVLAEDRRTTALVWFGADERILGADTVRMSTRYTPVDTGTIFLGISTVGHAVIAVDGREIFAGTLEADGRDLGACFLAPPAQSAPVDVVAGEAIDIVVTYTIRTLELGESLSVRFGIEPDRSDPDGRRKAAVDAAAAADVAIVVVGTNSDVESEGSDRTSLALPGRQDDLVRAVAAANRRTIVVVNAGAPVVLPWRNDVAAVLLTWFGGQEYGHALADVLTGSVEPGGRLPVTWPDRQEDSPVIEVTPVHGKLRYDEGINIGYRAWLLGHTDPAYAFGHGLGYTSWSLSNLSVETLPGWASRGTGTAATVRLDATNTGARRGKHVVQVYASRSSSTVERPVRWLVGFATVHAVPGETVSAQISLDRRAFAHWQDNRWIVEPGTFTLHAGSTVNDTPMTVSIDTEHSDDTNHPE